MGQKFDRNDDELYVGEIFAPLWQNKAFIAAITGLSIFLAGYYSLTAEKIFTAKAVFEIQESNTSGGFNFGPELGTIAALAGLRGKKTSNSDALIERMMAREFILSVNKKLSLENDPYFNNYSPNSVDPMWKAFIKKLIGWKATKAEKSAIIEQNIIQNYKSAVKPMTTRAGAISITVSHTNSSLAADYANTLMEHTRQLVETENGRAQEQRLTYLSETLADALSDMENAQRALKDYALENSALAQENFISGSLKLDKLRMEQRDALEITELLNVLGELIIVGNLDDNTYEALREKYPLVDDVDFRRILGMSETISAWSWPKIQTIKAVNATLRDRVKRLDIEIKDIESNAKIYASSAEGLAGLTRDAKVAEATYTVLIEQVKSQSLVAGFKPDTFKVFEYATTPLGPSAPRRNLIIGLSATLGFLTACLITLLISILRGVYYTRSSLIQDAQPYLTLKSNSMRRFSRLNYTKTLNALSKRRVKEVDEAEVTLANKNLVYIVGCNSRPTAARAARLLATQSSSSGRKLVLCDTTGLASSEISGEQSKAISDISVISAGGGFDILEGYNQKNSATFFTSSNFKKNIEKLMSAYDQVYVCAADKDAIVGLMALKPFLPELVVLTRIKKTRKALLRKIRDIHKISILFHD